MSKLDKLKSLKAQQANNALDLLKDNTDENLFDEMHKETNSVSNSELQNESHAIAENQPKISKTKSDEKITAELTDDLKEIEPTTTENKVEEIKKDTEKTVENISETIAETNVEVKQETTEKSEVQKNKKENKNKTEENEVYYINPTRQYTTQKAKEGTSKRLTIRVPLELYNDILEISETNKISMSLFARAAIENCLEVDNFNELIWYEPSIVKCQAKDSKFSITGKVRHKDVAGTKFITTVVRAEDYNKMIDIASEHDQIESLNDLFVIYLNTQLIKINE